MTFLTIDGIQRLLIWVPTEIHTLDNLHIGQKCSLLDLLNDDREKSGKIFLVFHRWPMESIYGHSIAHIWKSINGRNFSFRDKVLQAMSYIVFQAQCHWSSGFPYIPNEVSKYGFHWVPMEHQTWNFQFGDVYPK